ncbi:MAG: hypothetical protein KDF59_05330 [Nitrosomonas sp.]|nr:hypothetical protein [Nitrosomonas sp.]
MTRTKLRITLGIFFIIAHTYILFILFVAFLSNGFTYNEFITTGAIVLPVFAGYSMAIFNFIRDQKSSVIMNSEQLDSLTLFAYIFVPITFVLYISIIVYLKATNTGIANFDQFQGLLVVGETVYAMTTSHILYTLFGGLEEK